MDHSTSKSTLTLSAVHGSETPQRTLPGYALTVSSHGVALAEEMGCWDLLLSLWRGGRGERQDRAEVILPWGFQSEGLLKTRGLHGWML